MQACRTDPGPDLQGPSRTPASGAGMERLRAMKQHLIDDPVLRAILAVTLVVGIYGIWWGLPNVGSWDHDSSVPATALRGAACGFSGGWVGHHQPLQPMLISLACGPYIGYLVLSGGLDLSSVQRTYPWGLTDAQTSVTVIILIARVLSLLAYLVFVWLAYEIGLQMRSRFAGLALAIFAATYYPITYYAHVANPDMLCMALTAAAVLAYVLFLRKPDINNAVVLACCGALAASVKIQVIPVFAGMVPSALGALMVARKSGETHLRRGVLPVILVGIFTFGATFAVANNLAFNWDGFVKWTHGKTAGVEVSKERRGALADIRHPGESFAYRTRYKFVDSVSLPVLALAMVGLVGHAFYRPRYTGAFVLPFLAYAALYWKVHAEYVRYMLPCVLVMLVFAAMGADIIRERVLKRPALLRACQVLGVLVVTYLTLRAGGMDFLLTHGSRYQVRSFITRQIAASSMETPTVEIHRAPGYFPSFGPSVRVISLVPKEYHKQEFARRKNDVDIRASSLKTQGQFTIPDEEYTLEAVRQRGAQFVIVEPGAAGHRLIAVFEKPGSGYVAAFEAGGKTPLNNETFFANRYMRVYRPTAADPRPTPSLGDQ